LVVKILFVQIKFISAVLGKKFGNAKSHIRDSRFKIFE